MKRIIGWLATGCTMAVMLTGCSDTASTSSQGDTSGLTNTTQVAGTYTTSSVETTVSTMNTTKEINMTEKSTATTAQSTSATQSTKPTRTTRVTKPTINSTKYQGISGTNFEYLADRALVNVGNAYRFNKLMKKAERGEEIVIGGIGGSITAGVGASQQSTRYLERIGTWFRDTFHCKVKVVNAGIGATTSFFGVHRAQNDLLKYKPDMVIVEYAVNDSDTDIMKNSYEMLVRHILESESAPAVMLLCTMSEGGANVQEFHVECGMHYQLPVVSYRDALWPEVSSGRLYFSDITADNVHPNDNGHNALAIFCTQALDMIRKGTVPVDNSPYKLPQDSCYEQLFHKKPLTFKDATIVPANKLKVTKTGDVSLVPFNGSGDPVWQIGKGGTLNVDISGYSNVAFRYAYWNKGDMGYGSVKIDNGSVKLYGGETSKIYDGFFADYLKDNGTFSPEMLITGLNTKEKHTLNVAHVNMDGFYAPGTTGEHFVLVDLLVSKG